MIILGIADHVNSGAAIIADGVVVAAVNEERLIRKKMVFGVPRQSIATVIRLAGIRPSQIDHVGIATINGHRQTAVGKGLPQFFIGKGLAIDQHPITIKNYQLNSHKLR